MLSKKYFNTIKKLKPGNIYVENVRSLYNISTSKARVLCEMAVQDDVFVRRFGLVCPNTDCQRIIASYDSLESIPDTITCEICEMEGKEQFSFDTRDIQIIQFYQLK